MQMGMRWRKSLGDVLRELRERRKVDVPGLVKRLRQEGYPITEGEYNDIEADKTLPHDPRRFLEILTACLGLTREEFEELLRALGYAIFVKTVGGWVLPSLP
jgi:hypothetical protein